MDPATGRLLSASVKTRIAGSQYTEATFGDWRNVSGVNLPFRIELGDSRSGIEGAAIRVVSAEIDPKLDAAAFRLD